MENTPVKVISVGSPVVDLVLEVSEVALAKISGEKGGMELVEADEMAKILEIINAPPFKAPGGSAGNTAFALATMEMPSAFIGKMGNDDNGDYYKQCFRAIGGDCSSFKIADDDPTACCVSLVTPDSERTMRTALGAALQFSETDIDLSDFDGCTHLHVEGYLLFNEKLIRKVLSTAKEAGCTVSLDLGSFEVVRSCAGVLKGLLSDYVDIVFANEEESEAFCGDDDPEIGVNTLGEYCDIAAVKLGASGALIKNREGLFPISAIPAENSIDTTGAGDYWAAGFLFGYLSGYSVFKSGHAGSVLGKHIVEQKGAILSRKAWEQAIREISSTLGRGFSHSAKGELCATAG